MNNGIQSDLHMQYDNNRYFIVGLWEILCGQATTSTCSLPGLGLELLTLRFEEDSSTR